MKRILLATVAAAALWAAPSFAADPGMPMEEAPVGFSWTGGYVGVSLGYGWGDSSFIDRGNALGTFWNGRGDRFGADPDGVFGGGQAGYNWQSGGFVYGVEAEVGYLNLRDHGASSLSADTIGRVKGGMYGGLSARLGYAFDRTLIYAKAGGLYSAGKYEVFDNIGNTLSDGSETIGPGYQVGAGFEHAVTSNWTVKLEYAYFDFGSGNSSPYRNAATANKFRFDTDLDAHTVKVGVNYKF